MTSDFFAVTSLLIAVTALLLTLWQNVLQRRAAQAQVFLHILDQFNSNDVYNGFMTLYNLQPYENFETFKTSESPDTQIQLLKLIDFLNDTARLVLSGYLGRQSVWDLYFTVYRTANEKLIPWWLEGQRQSSHPQRFLAFEDMCRQIARISEDQIAKYDRKVYHVDRPKYWQFTREKAKEISNDAEKYDTIKQGSNKNGTST